MPRAILITHNGKTQSMSRWAKEIGISRQALFLRLRRGWPVDVAVEVPSIDGGIVHAANDNTEEEAV